MGSCASGVIGVSNLFADAIGTPQLPAAITLIESNFPGRSLVSYEPTASLPRSRALGLEATGPLRVWVRDTD